jgi:hypothetical protein
MDIIKALKENEKPYGLMSEEMRAKACELCDKESVWQIYTKLGWGDQKNGIALQASTVYRLRPDYAEEPEVVKCKVYESQGELRFDHDIGNGGKQVIALDRAIVYSDFIGFLYEDGGIYTLPRRYIAKDTIGIGKGMDIERIQDYTVWTPTHVLFRGSNG